MNSRTLGRVSCVLLLAALIAGCASGLRRFPNEQPMREDPDRKPFSPKPEEYFSPFGWDAADQTIFRPISRFFAVDPGDEAVNVNAMDEVPDSSWFTNRIGRDAMTPERFAEASCADVEPLDPSGPWTVVSAKPGGANAGFVMEDQRERKYVVKFDGERQPERATVADVVGSIFYWGAGYFAPCNRPVFFRRDILGIADDATAETSEGDEVPMSEDHLDQVFDEATRLKDGRYRGMASRFIDGEPVGPWRYQGTRDDDPNDVVPHEDRRELRGAYVLASWINHWDSREANTLSAWIPTDEEGDERGYIRHYYIDFGETLGSIWFSWPSIARRLGYAYYLDIPYMMEDLVTLGFIDRPWEEIEMGPTGYVLGFFADVSVFEPDEWRPGYPNPAFGRMTERDAAWMARIIAQIGPEHVGAAVDEAQVVQPLVREELMRVLLARRDKILRRWLRRLSPLTEPEIVTDGDRAKLCMRDLVVHAELLPWDERPYRKRAWAQRSRGDTLARVELGAMTRRRPEQVCVELPQLSSSTSGEQPPYLIVDLTGLWGAGDERSRPARVHMYRLGPTRYRIVGLERPYESTPPGE